MLLLSQKHAYEDLIRLKSHGIGSIQVRNLRKVQISLCYRFWPQINYMIRESGGRGN